MIRCLGDIVFWWRTRRDARELELRLQIRRRGRAARQRSANKGASTKYERRMAAITQGRSAKTNGKD